MISVTILTKNCQETLELTLKSLEDFKEVLVFDTGSTDRTLAIAASFQNVKIATGEFIGFGKTHNFASALAKYDFILSIDSDEVLSPALVQEIKALSLDPQTVYSIQRHNFFNGKHIKCCSGWHPDFVYRLYNRQHTAFSDAPVHEKILTDNFKKIRLKSPVFHTPYRNISDFLAKMQTYSSLFAEKPGTKISETLWKPLIHSWFAFFKSYILKRGFLAGKEGLIISMYNGHTAFYKYLKRAEKAN
ncbi:MAG: glycosyltransferase family 2 protein [Chlamydiota bacterium]